MDEREPDGREPGGRESDGRELALVRPAEARPIVRRRRTGGWTQARRRQFLDALAATCNVSEAAAETGMSLGGAYTLRRRDPEFRVAWAAALECGYARLEAMLLARAAGTDAPPRRAGVETAVAPRGGDAFDPGAHGERTEGLDTALALALLRLHRANIGSGDGRGAGRGAGRGGGRPVTKTDPDELAEAILRRLDALNKRRGGAA